MFYTCDNMAQSSNVVKAYQEEMNFPFVPKGSFGLSVVGADGFPTTLFFGFFRTKKKAYTFYKSVDPEPQAHFVAHKE
jgi:hypothetical protein